MTFTPLTYRPFFFMLVACVMALFAGCRKIPKFSDTPNIQYKNIRKQTYYNADQLIDADSIIVGIHFEDGDGDIGFPVDERTEANIDFFVDVYRQTNGVFGLVTLPSGVTFDGHIPQLTPVSTPGPIEGDLFYSMIFNYSTSQALNDTLKFVVKLHDRKGNVSNSVETKPVIVRKNP